MYENMNFDFETEGTTAIEPTEQGVEFDLSAPITPDMELIPYDSDDLPFDENGNKIEESVEAEVVVETTDTVTVDVETTEEPETDQDVAEEPSNLVPMPGIERLAELKAEYPDPTPVEEPVEEPTPTPEPVPEAEPCKLFNVTVVPKHGTAHYNERIKAESKEEAIEKVKASDGITEVMFASAIEVITVGKKSTPVKEATVSEPAEKPEDAAEDATDEETSDEASTDEASEDTEDAENTTEANTEEKKELPPPVIFEDEYSKLQEMEITDKEKSILYMLNHYHVSPDLLNALLSSDFSESWKKISELNTENVAVREKLTKELGDKRDDRIKVIRYLVDKAKDPEFAKLVLMEHKDFNRCYKYITDKVRESFGSGGTIQVSDDTVYGWAVDYYQLDDYAEVMEERRKEEEKKAKAKEKAEAKKKTAEKKAEKEKLAAEKKAKAEEKAKAAAEKKAKLEAERKAKAEEKARKAEEKAKAEAEKKAAEAPKPIDECHVEEANGQISFIF